MFLLKQYHSSLQFYVMGANLRLIAQKFCMDCFTNALLDSKQFIDKVNELMSEVGPIEEKLILLNEVIRIGKLFYNTDGNWNKGLEYYQFPIFPTAN